VRGAVRGKVAASFVDQGEQAVKNIPERVRTFRVLTGSRAAGSAADSSTLPGASRTSLRSRCCRSRT
jgi:class 3 adenylate cyclase